MSENLSYSNQELWVVLKNSFLSRNNLSWHWGIHKIWYVNLIMITGQTSAGAVSLYNDYQLNCINDLVYDLLIKETLEDGQRHI